MKSLNPALVSFKRTISLSNKKNRLKVGGAAFIAAAFFVGEYLFFFKMLVYFSKTQLIGELLIEKMLFMVNLIFFALLIFSNIVTSVSTYYASDDLPLILSTPITYEKLFYTRLIQTIIKSSWMVILFGMPIYIAYGTVLGGNVLYYILMFIALIAFMFIAASTGIILTMMVTYILPARRFRELMIFLSLILFIAVYIGFRMIRPERFLNPQRFENVMGYLSTLRSSQSTLIPSTWLSSTLMSTLSHNYVYAMKTFLPLVMTALGVTATGVFATYLFYRNGFTKAQESKNSRLNRSNIFYKLFHIFTKKSHIFVNAIIKKDTLSFFRDTSQWSQLLLLGALILVYVYNFTALPLKSIPFPTIYIKNIVAFVNMGLAAFVITAIAVRFAFSSVSLEGRALWLIKVSPNDLSKLIKAKFIYNLIPLLIIAVALVFFTNYVLGVFEYIMFLSLTTMIMLTVAITYIGVGFGAIYPKYHYENVADISMGFGGFVFMITSLGLTGIVLVIQAIPTYSVMKEFSFSAGLSLYDYVWISSLYLLSAAVTIYPAIYIRNKALKAIKTTEG